MYQKLALGGTNFGGSIFKQDQAHTNSTDLVQVVPKCLAEPVHVLFHHPLQVLQLLHTVLLWQRLVAPETRTNTCDNLSQRKDE